MKIECDCGVLIDGDTLASFDFFDPENGPPALYSFLECSSCHTPLVVVQENYGHGWDEPFRLYPPKERQLSQAIPEPIRRAFGEARSCYKTHAYTAAAIMCRKALEAICSAHGANGNNLNIALKDLKEKGVIESRLYEWADALRISGNEAAHDVSVTVSQEDAHDVLEFANALLEYIFTFRDQFEAFKERRLSRGGE